MKVICIIPARGGSKRLSRKNITPVLGKPMISYALSAAFDSRYIGKNVTYVSTEDTEIAEISASLGATVVDRPASLAEDTVWTQEVVEHAVKVIEEKTGDYFDIIVRVQANSPQVTSTKIDECIEKLINNGLWEVFTVDQHGIEDAAVHVMLRRCVDQRALSVYKGVVTTNYLDIHEQKDIAAVERIMGDSDE